MPVHANPCRLYLNPTTTLTGGTEVPNVDGGRVVFTHDEDAHIGLTGFGVNSGPVITRAREVGMGVLAIPLRDHGNDALNMLLSWLTSSAAAQRPTGGNSVLTGRRLPVFAMVVRPLDTALPVIYAPRWRQMDTRMTLTMGRIDALFDDMTLYLMACDSGTSGVPAWMRGAAATVDSVYSLEGA